MSKGDKKKIKFPKLNGFKIEKIKNLKSNFNLKDIEKIPLWLWGIFLLLALVIIAEMIYLIVIFQQKKKPIERVVWQNQESIFDDQLDGYVRAIDGVLVENEDDTNNQLAGVMIDNMINARPPYGLSKANLVIESITESDITRFLAIFDLSQEIDKIGPVRSARPYFAQWGSEFGLLYVHSGGSPEALDNLANGAYNVYDFNEFYRGSYFWRDYNRYAPHNLFTSTENLSQGIEDYLDDNDVNYAKYSFKDELDVESRGEDGQEIEIYFNAYDHYVKWVYDKENNEYLRYQAGSKHLEADGSEIRAKNIAVQYVSMEVLDSAGRKRIPTVDSKSAIVFSDGQVVEGYWKKEDLESRTKFYTNDDKEIEFNRGVTWIEVVPVGVEVNVE